MLRTLKRRFYFLVAAYFAFWAKRVLHRWQPTVIVVTGSSGKTTTLHLVEAQLGDKAVYSHHANSSIGIPFHLLGLTTNVSSPLQWLGHFIKAPFLSGRRAPTERLYVVEADCDRPHEGAFLAKFLQPAITLWVSVYRTHSQGFDKLVGGGQFATHEQAIAYEFGHFAAQTQKLVLTTDQPVITDQLKRVKPGVVVKQVSLQSISTYQLDTDKTTFVINDQTITLPGLHAKTLGDSLQLVSLLLDDLGLPLDNSYRKLVMPPGRSNILAGKRHTTLIDSTYNTGLDATTSLLELFTDYPAKHKWLVLGDILEQGSLEQTEHERLAAIIKPVKAERVILIGPRTRKYTLPLLAATKDQITVSFERPDEVLAYLQRELTGGEALLFKGGRFLEGVIEQLLADPADAAQLVRREPAWVKRRQSWGLPR